MQPSLPAYAELHCLSNFSFLRGASHPGELVEKAHELGYRALAITDECSMAGVVRAHEAVKKLPPDTPLKKLIIGSEIRLDDGLKLVLLATHREGYGNLCSLITRGRTRGDKGSYHLARDDLHGGLPGCLALLVPGIKPDAGQARFVAECFPHRAWIAVELFCGPNDKSQLARLRELGRNSGLPLVAAGDVHMHKRSHRPLQDVLTAIRLGIPVAQAGHALYPNAERHLRHPLRLARLYPPELLAESLEIAARCDFSLDSLRYEYPEEIVPAGHTPTTYLRELTEKGLRRHFPQGVTEKIHNQVEAELTLIQELGYEPFFLTVHDVVEFAKSRDILCQGRGSAANSLVCYALGITAAGPERLNMLFERFISRERKEPPTSTSISNTSGGKKSFSTSTTNTVATAPRSPPRSSPTSGAAPCATSAKPWASVPRNSIGLPNRSRGGTTPARSANVLAKPGSLPTAGKCGNSSGWSEI